MVHLIVNANVMVQNVIQTKNNAVISFIVGAKSIMSAKIILWFLVYRYTDETLISTLIRHIS